MNELISCVAGVLGLAALELPDVVVMKRANFGSRFGNRLFAVLHPIDLTIVVKEGYTPHMIAHEYAHFLQMKHGIVRVNRSGLPVFRHEHEAVARKAGIICG